MGREAQPCSRPIRPAEDRRRIILIVEDEILIRMNIADEFRNAGFEVIEAANAQEALSILQADQAVDAVFSDVKMPGSLDGIALARRIRADYPSIKVFVTSGHSAPSGLDGAIDGFVRKPYDPPLVIEKIRQSFG